MVSTSLSPILELPIIRKDNFMNSVSFKVFKEKLDKVKNKKIQVNSELSLIREISIEEQLLGIFSPIHSRYSVGSELSHAFFESLNVRPNNNMNNFLIRKLYELQNTLLDSGKIKETRLNYQREGNESTIYKSMINLAYVDNEVVSIYPIGDQPILFFDKDGNFKDYNFTKYKNQHVLGDCYDKENLKIGGVKIKVEKDDKLILTTKGMLESLLVVNLRQKYSNDKIPDLIINQFLNKSKKNLVKILGTNLHKMFNLKQLPQYLAKDIRDKVTFTDKLYPNRPCDYTSNPDDTLSTIIHQF